MKKRILSVAVAASCCLIAVIGCTNNATAYGLTKKEYSEIFGKASQLMLTADPKTTENDASTGISLCKYEADDDLSFVKSTGAFVYFLSELYKNDEFLLSENPVEFTCAYEQENFTIAMLAYCDKESGTVTGEIFSKEIYEGKPLPESYLNIDIKYDFETETVLAFDLGQCNWDTTIPNAYWTHDIYRDGIIYSLRDTEDEERIQFKENITAKKNSFADKLEKVEKLNADFTDEYVKSMELLFS